MSTLVYQSAVVSLALQIMTSGITVASLFVPVPADAVDDLNLVVILETASQLIEFVWYVVAVCFFGGIKTWARYVDWAVSTPIMLVSAVFFFRLRRGVSLVAALQASSLYAILGLNWLMLACGFAAEYKNAIPKIVALPLGGIALVGSYTLLIREVDVNDAFSVGLYASMYASWALYGVAAAFGDVPKNVAYNGLDIVSKNLYGVFLFAYALFISNA